MTDAFQSLFDSVARVGATEDPLAQVCRCIVGHSGDVLFAFYCYENDETGQIVARRNAVDVSLLDADMQRKIVSYIRKLTCERRLVEIDPRQAQEELTPAERERWSSYRGLASEVTDGTHSVAILAVFFLPGFAVHDVPRGWMRLYSQAASFLIQRQSVLRQAQCARSEAVRAHARMTLRLEAVRAAVREHEVELSEASRQRLSALLDEWTEDDSRGWIELSDEKLEAWVDEGFSDSRLKVIVGLRGTGKSTVLHAIRARALAAGVPEGRTVTIDFEDARFRRFKAPGDVIAYLESLQSSSRTSYLFLNEVGRVTWHRELLQCLRDLSGWNVWMTASSAQAIVFPDGTSPESAIRVYRLWTDPKRPRSCDDLERIWCQVFMRDMAGGVDHVDMRAIELLAECYSDHLGEVTSLRTITRKLDEMGRHLAKSSVCVYRQALEDAYLVEMSEIYDVFEGAVVRPSVGRMFYTDLELRNWRFGCAPTEDATRLALNRLYLELRRTYDKVYTPRDCTSDFVTVDASGKIRAWKLPGGGLVHPELFRCGRDEPASGPEPKFAS